jgi:hypothetical protein
MALWSCGVLMRMIDGSANNWNVEPECWHSSPALLRDSSSRSQA